ncbi:MAG TPA: MFS transporter, partial [Methanocella sp.]|nr:MFS transporter [Methanocella sp.]
LLIAVFLLRDTRPATARQKLRLRDVRMILNNRIFLFYCLIAGFMLIPYQQMYTLLSVYASSYVGLNQFWVGALFAESGIIVVLLQFVVSARVKRYRMTTSLAVCSLIFAGGFALLTVSTAAFLPFISMVIVTFAEMIWAPAGSALQATLAPEDKRGRYFGFSGMITSIGYATGPLFGGLLKDSMNNNVPSMWAVVGAMFIICCIGYLILGRIMRDKALT